MPYRALLAFRAVGHHYRERLDASARIPAKHTARLLGITRDLDVGSRQIKVTHAARLVMGMVRKFCYTTDRQVMARHMEPVNGLDGPGQDYLARTLLPYAHRAWEDICSPAGRLRFEHDHYMKLWAMTSPRLGADFVLLDEAQDTNPVLEEVFLAQDAQRVCVGDPAQQIYGWRNARCDDRFPRRATAPDPVLPLRPGHRRGGQPVAGARRVGDAADRPRPRLPRG